MFNETVKSRFLATLKRPANYRVFFNGFAEYEAKLGMDLALMTRAQIAQGLGSMDYIVYNVVENYISMVKQYLLWYADENPGTVTLEVMKLNWKDVDLTENIRHKLISSESDILTEFPDYRPTDGHFVIPVYLLAFYGLNLKAICSLKKRDVVCNSDSVVIVHDSAVLRIDSPVVAKALTDYMEWQGTKVKTASSEYTMVPEKTEMLLYRRLRGDDTKDYPPLVGDQVTARLYSIKNRVAGGHGYSFDIGEVRVSGQYLRMCNYFRQNGNWPDRVTLAEILGKKCRDDFERQRLIGGAELYQKVFGL